MDIAIYNLARRKSCFIKSWMKREITIGKKESGPVQNLPHFVIFGKICKLRQRGQNVIQPSMRKSYWNHLTLTFMLD